MAAPYGGYDDDGESISTGTSRDHDDYDDDVYGGNGGPALIGAGFADSEGGVGLVGSGAEGGVAGVGGGAGGAVVDFDDPRIASLPRILLMGPRRAGKTSIQRVVFHKMSPHETLFRLEATQLLERAVVDHTPLCRFTIWDFPGDQYEYHGHDNDGGLVDGGGAAGGDGAAMGGDEEGTPGAASEDGSGYGDPRSRSPGGTATPPPGAPPTPVSDGEGNHQANGNQQNQEDQIFSKATALIFVLDAQDEPYDHVLQSFTDAVTRAVRANPSIAVEVFVHKVDGELFLSDEAKYDCRRDVMQQVADELADAGIGHDAMPISYHLTSIYDHSVFEAFSRVVQRLIPELPTLEHLLNVLVSTCSMEKAYLFDVASKLYISTDSSPVDMQSVELCSDMIDVVLDVSGIYGLGGGGGGDNANKNQNGAGGGGGAGKTDAPPPLDDGKDDFAEDLPYGAEQNGGGFGDGGDFHGGGGDAALPVDSPHPPHHDGDVIDHHHHHAGGVEDGIDRGDDELLGKLVGQTFPSEEDDEDDDEEDDPDDDDVADPAGESAYDAESSSTIHLSNGMVLYLKEVDTMLALVCLTRAENFRKKSLIDYNIGCLKRALRALPSSSSNAAAGGGAGGPQAAI